MFKVYGIFGAVVVVLASLLYVTHNRLSVAKQDAKAFELLAEETEKTLKEERESARRVQLDSINRLKELQERINEDKIQSASVDSGTTILRINADCPALPKASAGSSVDNAGTAQLARESRPDYYAHRADARKITAQLLGCQNYIKTECSGE